MVVISHGADKNGIIPIAEAIAIAIKHVPGDVVKAEMERGLYEIKVRTAEGKTEMVYVDSSSGEVFEKKIITLDEATAIATKKVSGKVIKVEFEKGRYEVKIVSSTGTLKEVYVDGKSGEIIKMKEKKRD